MRIFSEITDDYCEAQGLKKGVKISTGWLEDKQALKFAEELVILVKEKMIRADDR